MSDDKLPGLGTLLRELGKSIDAQYESNREAYERGELPKLESIRYTSRRPNWCNRCSKDSRLMPENIPQALPGSSLCAKCQHVEREMRTKLRAEQAKKNQPVRKLRFGDE